MDLHEVFARLNDEYLEFKEIDESLKISKRPELCVMLYLDKLLPDGDGLLESCDHERVFLQFDCDKFAEIATEDDVRFLLRCGILYDVESEKFYMNV